MFAWLPLTQDLSSVEVTKHRKPLETSLLKVQSYIINRVLVFQVFALKSTTS